MIPKTPAEWLERVAAPKTQWIAVCISSNPAAQYPIAHVQDDATVGTNGMEEVSLSDGDPAFLAGCSAN